MVGIGVGTKGFIQLDDVTIRIPTVMREDDEEEEERKPVGFSRGFRTLLLLFGFLGLICGPVA